MNPQPSDAEYLTCSLPYMYEVDLVIDGYVFWRDVGFRMAYDKYLQCIAQGQDAIIYPAWFAPESPLPTPP